MEKFVLALVALGIITLTGCCPCGCFPQVENIDAVCFYPPDLVPHPHIPGDKPSGPPEPEMV